MAAAGHFRCRSALAVLCLLPLVLLGCAAGGGSHGKGAAPEDVLAQRAEARWQALIEGEFAAAYEFATPAYREVHTPRMYRSRFGGAVAWTEAKVIEVLPDADGQTATVRVMISYQAMGAGGGITEGQRPIDERWIYTGGEWWHIEQ